MLLEGSSGEPLLHILKVPQDLLKFNDCFDARASYREVCFYLFDDA